MLRRAPLSPSRGRLYYVRLYDEPFGGRAQRLVEHLSSRGVRRTVDVKLRGVVVSSGPVEGGEVEEGEVEDGELRGSQRHVTTVSATSVFLFRQALRTRAASF